MLFLRPSTDHFALNLSGCHFSFARAQLEFHKAIFILTPILLPIDRGHHFHLHFFWQFLKFDVSHLIRILLGHATHRKCAFEISRITLMTFRKQIVFIALSMADKLLLTVFFLRIAAIRSLLVYHSLAVEWFRFCSTLVYYWWILWPSSLRWIYLL